MLPDSQHSQFVCESDEGLFKNANPNSLIIDCGTISPKVSVSLNQIGKKYKITYVDAPVSGGIMGAQQGTLTFIVGAEDNELFERIKPILNCMGKKFFNCGKPGVGQMAKMCNNLSAAIQMIAIS